MPPAARTAPNPSTAPSAGGRKILGLPRNVVFIGVPIIFVGAIAYFLWSRKKSAATGPTSASASSSTSTSTSGLDLSAIQDQLAALMDQQAADTDTTSGGITTGTGTGTGTTTGTGTGTGTKTTPPPVKTPKPDMPGGVHPTRVTPTSFTLTWNKTPNATRYRVRITYQDKLVGAAHNIAGNSITITGLGKNHTYTAHVAAIGPGGTSAETNGPAVKTAK